MNKILITLLMFLSANAFATDNYNAASNVLTIPSVIVGSNTFNNVVVQMGNFSVLSYSPNPSIGTVLYDDATINVTLTGSSRETPTATGSRGVLFSLLITNKTASEILIAQDASSSSILTDNKGQICSSLNSGGSGPNLIGIAAGSLNGFGGNTVATLGTIIKSEYAPSALPNIKIRI